jgi:GNAT superfamily N-acetyltransferase
MASYNQIAFRVATEDDFDFLYGLHVLAMKPWVEQTWGWDQADQLRFFRAEFDPSVSRVILVDGQDAGVLSVDTAVDVFIPNIELLPRFQRRGLGTRILRDILADADRDGQSVTLRALKVIQRCGYTSGSGSTCTGKRRRTISCAGMPHLSS